MKRLNSAGAILTVAAAVALTGCSASVSVGGKTVSKADLQNEVASALAGQKGVPVDQVPTVTCPKDLDAKVGATTTCTLGDSGSDIYDVSVKVTKVDESTGKASFDIQVASQPN